MDCHKEGILGVFDGKKGFQLLNKKGVEPNKRTSLLCSLVINAKGS
jgi:hypothetical protein